MSTMTYNPLDFENATVAARFHWNAAMGALRAKDFDGYNRNFSKWNYFMAEIEKGN